MAAVLELLTGPRYAEGRNLKEAATTSLQSDVQGRSRLLLSKVDDRCHFLDRPDPRLEAMDQTNNLKQCAVLFLGLQQASFLGVRQGYKGRL